MGLIDKSCVPCRGGVPPLEHDAIVKFRAELADDWQVIDDHHLDCTWTFADFAQALSFTNLIGALAETEDHHPDIYLAWGKVRVTLWTHDIDGLTESDFILAAKIDGLSRG